MEHTGACQEREPARGAGECLRHNPPLGLSAFSQQRLSSCSPCTSEQPGRRVCSTDSCEDPGGSRCRTGTTPSATHRCRRPGGWESEPPERAVDFLPSRPDIHTHHVRSVSLARTSPLARLGHAGEHMASLGAILFLPQDTPKSGSENPWSRFSA